MGKSSYDVMAETRASIEQTLAKILLLKKEGRSSSLGHLRELHTQTSVALLNLRQISWIIFQDEKRARQETEAAKIPVDDLTLELNNLLYQRSHYLQAIRACKDFRSRCPDIELVSEEEVFKGGSEQCRREEEMQDNAHKQMLERLNFELLKRKEMCKQREALEARKKMLEERLANQKKFMSSLPSYLKALKKASSPLQQQLGIQCTRRLNQQPLSELLPDPLYILCMQILDQKEAFDENMELEIEGSVKDAQAAAYQQGFTNPRYIDGICEGDKPQNSIKEEDNDDADFHPPRKRAKTLKHASNEDVYSLHPLSVLWHIYDEFIDGQKGSKLLTLRFVYLTRLRLVCVGVEGSHDGQQSILAQLYPDDTGLELPTQVAKLIAGVDFRYDFSRSLHPYKWAQHLAGISFLGEIPPDRVSTRESSRGAPLHNGLRASRRQHRVPIILEKLRRQCKAQSACK